MGDSRTPILFQLHQADAGKVPLKENECGARGSAETIDRLVRIAHRKNVALFPCQQLQDFHLGKVTS